MHGSRLICAGQKTLFHLNHPIQWVQLTGMVVSVDHIDHLWIFNIDDSSGALAEVVMPRDKQQVSYQAGAGELIKAIPATHKGRSELGNEVDFQSLVVGQLVKVKGGLKEFRGQKQVSLERMGM